MNARTTVFFGLGLAALAVAAVSWRLGTSQTPVQVQLQPPLSASGSSTGSPAQGVVSISAIASSVPVQAVATSAPIKATPLARKLAEAKDWRAFALEARKHPELGGRFYALYAANLCGRSAAAIKQLASESQAKQLIDSGTVSSQHLAASESVTTRCSAFVPGEIDELMAAIRTESADGADPLLKARKVFLDGKAKEDKVAVRDAVQQILASSDPLLMSSNDLLLMAMSFQEKQDGSKSLWFDGKAYDIFADPSEATALRLATQLGTCALGDVCSLDDSIALSCLGQTECITDRTEYVRGQYMQSPGASPEGFSHVLNLAERIKGAIQRRDINAFVRP